MDKIVPLKRQRNSNIEILRILCMLAIIAHHCIVHGGGYAMENSINKIIALLVIPAGKIGFCCFVAISAWFLVDSEYKGIRVLKLWLEVLFYNLVFVGATALLGDGYASPITWRNWLGAFFPIIGNTHGYAASYIAFYLLTPFLKMIANHLNKKSAGWLVGLLFTIQVFSTILAVLDYYSQPVKSEVTLFVLFYFTAFYIKRWPIRIEKNKVALWGILLACYGLVAAAWIGASYFPQHITVFNFVISISGDESSISNILAGFSLLLIVKDWKVPTIPWINKIATTILGILLIHDHNYFRPVVWHRFVRASEWYCVDPLKFVVLIVMYSIAVFGVGMIIDLLRQKFLEAPIMRSRTVANICERLDGIFTVNENKKEM